MTDEDKEFEAKLVEYQELQHLRDIWSKGMGAREQIFIPLGAAIVSFFVTVYLKSLDGSSPDVKIYFLFIGWALFSLIMFYWRYLSHIVDQQIVGMYPRMLELESQLGMEMQASYYYRNLNLKAKNRLAEIVSGLTCEELKKWDYRKFKRYLSANKSNSPYYYLLKVWDDFVSVNNAPWFNKFLARCCRVHLMNYSVTSRGHAIQNVIIGCMIGFWLTIDLFVAIPQLCLSIKILLLIVFSALFALLFARF